MIAMNALEVAAPPAARLSRLLLLIVLALAPQCGCVPRDPEDTLKRVESGILRVGISTAPPWVIADEEPQGIEIDLARALAQELGVDIVWEVGAESVLFQKLKHFELHLVLCGAEKKSPWHKDVGFTRPYVTAYRDNTKEEHVWAVPPGENAWLMRVERYLAEVRPTAQRRWEEAN